MVKGTTIGGLWDLQRGKGQGDVHLFWEESSLITYDLACVSYARSSRNADARRTIDPYGTQGNTLAV